MRRAAVSILLSLATLAAPAFSAPPRLERRGSAQQLIVDEEPFLILGGELTNSAASSLAYLEPAWARFEALHMNTVLSPVSWQLIEPAQGRFDFSLVDGLLQKARAHHLRLVLLWFGSWKNSMSSYVPAWVKRDQAHFPRAELDSGAGLEMLSPFADQNWIADARAFAALMKHLKAVDGAQNTVLMVQVENEVGMLPSARDASAAADARFAAPVPAALTDYLVAHRARLAPELRELWEKNGAKTAGSWTAVFGAGPASEEIFMAWFFARYVDAVAATGRAVYALPLFANVALNRPGKRPGEYPSGGPLPHLLDVWRAGAPTLDFLSPDIYFPNFVEIVGRYARPDNPLFIPEANRARLPEAGANAFFAIGEHDALGFSPFAIDALEQPEKSRLAFAYGVLSELAPTLLAARGLGRTRGFRPPVSHEGALNEAAQSITLGDFTFNVSFIDRWTPRSEQQVESHGGLLVQLGPEEYLAAGSGFSLEVTPKVAGAPSVGIESVWEGRFVAGRWVPGRLLNGDETHQGRLLLMPRAGFGIQRLELYRYR